VAHGSLGLYFQVHRHNIRTCLRATHRQAAARRLLEAGSRWLELEWLAACPCVARRQAYAHQLNPTEQVWNHTRYGDLANYIAEDIDALCREVERSIGAKRSCPGLLRSFFNHAERHL